MLNVPEPGQLTPVQVTASPLESTISRPSVLKGPYGHPEDDSFAARRGKYVMSLGCGDKAAAFTEVTASAAAQNIDFIVNTAIVYKVTGLTAKQIYQSTLPTRSIYSNGRRLHLVRGCGGMSSAKMSKLLSILHLFQHDQVFSVGSMQAEFKQTSTSVKVYIVLLRRFCAVQVTTAWSARCTASYGVSTRGFLSGYKGRIMECRCLPATLSLRSSLYRATDHRQTKACTSICSLCSTMQMRSTRSHL